MRMLTAVLAMSAATLSLNAEPARAIDVSPDGLTNYSNCVNQAKEHNRFHVLDRHLLYRCHLDVATSYFNFLGRRHVRDRVVNEPTGTFVYRDIEGVGRCWNKIADADGAPVSYYGCDIYVET